ncbi:MAG: DNA primase DnaG [Candidatus Pacearchaeota archaeon]
MAKISPTSIKYSIIADFIAEGPFQKPDVIGALFGQTEGLLGSDMELRELQKEGKIGRIEVELKTEGGKTTGEIIIPSALDKTETTIIAAALETIDKIGPTDAKISIKEIEDVRGSKRDYIMERAKQLLSGIKNEGMDSVEIETELRESSRIAKVIEYGDEKLSAGPEVESSKEVIVVEGRADVINLLRYGIKNAIGMQGTRFPRTITKLGEEKELTLFVDGDRGGKLIARNVCDNAKISFIAIAPDGKEVEELSGKEILQALRKKIPSEEFFKKFEETPKRKFGVQKDNYLEKTERRKITNEDISRLRDLSKEIKGKNVLVINDKLEIVQNVPSSRVGSVNPKDAYILLTSTATNTIIENAEKLNSKAVAAKNFSRTTDTNIELISL